MNSRRGGAVRQNEFPEAIMVTHTEAQAKQIFERGITHGRATVLETMSGNRFDLDPTLNRSKAAYVERHKDRWFGEALDDLLLDKVNPGV